MSYVENEDCMTLLTFESVTPERFTAIAAKVKALTGMSITAVNGIAQQNGYKMSWTHDAATGNLSITVLEKPFLVPEFAVTNKITAIVNGTEPEAA